MKTNLLKRTRIDQLLEAAADYPLTIVEAPMGYGKTTAVRLFFENHHIAPVWVGFHQQAGLKDWEKFAQEIARRDARTGTTLLSLGFPADAPQLDQVMAVLSQFAGDQHQVIVLDDYHLLHSSRVNQFLERLVLEQIDNLHLIMITRHTIGFNAALLIAKGLCRMITQEMLKFSETEVKAYCQLMAEPLPPADLVKICSYGDGWISLTYMMLLGLQQGIPIGLNLSLEALIEQTLYRNLDQEIRDFLVELSLLERFTGEQAVYVTEFAAAEETLKRLRQENSFISYDETQRCYTIHAVLLDFLKNRQRFSAEQKKRRHLRLGEWFLKEQAFPEAYRHFYLAGEPLRILVHLNQPEHIRNEMGEFEGSQQMVATLPLECLFSYPIAYLQFILVALLRGNEAEAAVAGSRLDQLEAYYLQFEGIEEKLRNRVLAEILIMRKFTLFNYIDASTKMNDRIISLLDGEQSYIMRRENEFTFGSPHLLYMYFREAGQFWRTTQLIVEKFPVYPQYADGCGTGAEYLALAEYSLETGDWEKAALNSQKAIYKAAGKDQYTIIICANFVLLRLKLRNGEVDQALDDFHQLETDIQARHNPIFNTMLELCKGYLYAILGQPEKIPYWLQVGDMKAAELFYQGVAFNYLVYGKAVAAARDFIKLGILAETFDEYFSIYHNQLGFIHNGIFAAIASYQLDGLKAGLSALETVLSEARPDGIMLPFVEQAELLLPLLEERVQQQPEDAFAGQILRESQTYLAHLQKERPQSVVLTQREQEVLTLMAQGYKREAIAENLFISTGTVKTHLQNIYKKLDVKGKNAAINTAVHNGLLDLTG